MPQSELRRSPRLERRCAVSAALWLVASGCGGGGGGGGGGSTSRSANLFNETLVIEETRRMEDSASPIFWLTSGARFFEQGSRGHTIEGDLPPGDPWRQIYAHTNPGDTDDGVHPQNVFRMLLRAAFDGVRVRAICRVERTNPSSSPHRTSSNGVFVLARYLDDDDFYAGGVRVDGSVVIKRKRAGIFTTLAIAPKFGNGAPWDRNANPNLIPTGRDIDVDLAVTTGAGGVALALAVDGASVLEATDGNGAIEGAGLAGLTSDFMDVDFERFEAGPAG